MKELKEKYYPIILDVGPVDETQGTHILVNAMPAIIKVFPKAKLILVGSIVDWSIYMKVKSSKIKDRVLFTGFIPDQMLVKFYHTADVVFEIPYWHGFGLPIIEAMACGKPVVTRNAYSMREHILLSRAGYLLKKNDPESVVEALKHILKNYDELSRNALSYAQRFDIKRIADKYMKIFTHADGRSLH